MRTRMQYTTSRLAGLLAAVALCGAVWVRSEEPAPAWPRRVMAAPHTVALYEPQVESYEQDWVNGRAAVSVAKDGGEPVFGAVWFGLRLTLNADKSLGRVSVFRLDQTRFPEGDVIDKSTLERLLGNSLIGADLAMAPLLQSLERERAALAAAAAGSDVVPDILFTTVPVALVRIDGEPELKAVPDSDLLSVVNATTPILLQKGTARWFMQVEGRWLAAAAVTGPWQDAGGVPESVSRAVAAGTVSAAVTTPLQIVVVTRATEVIQTDGEPRYTIIPGADLLYANNTDADLFLDIADQKHYALLAGRWFATPSLEKGPWEAVAAERLPKSFAAIPPGSAKYGVLAHVPGTAVAQEAVQDAAVPRVQSVKRDVVNITVEYDGDPEFVQAGQTTVYYAANTPYSVVRVAPYYYLCYSGVWYYGVTAVGPWTVSVSVPGAIYTLPPTCPVYPVTYVRVYDWTPDVVYFGFTSGYVGWYAGWSGLVFGFSYYDDDWWHRHHHHGRYYHNYRCGYRPYHGWGGGPTPYRGGPGGPGPGRPGPRPGPEYHAYTRPPAAGRPGREPVSERRPARDTLDRHTPTRYVADRGPLAVGREHARPGPLSERSGRVERTALRPEARTIPRPTVTERGPDTSSRPRTETRVDRDRSPGRGAAEGAGNPTGSGPLAPAGGGVSTAPERPRPARPDRSEPERSTPTVRPVTPTPERTAPEVRSVAPARERAVPEVRSVAPLPERTAPEARSTAPARERTMPEVRSVAPTPERAAPEARSTAPARERAAPETRSTAPARERAAPAPVVPSPVVPATPATPSAPRGSDRQKPANGLNSSYFEQRRTESVVRESAAFTAPAPHSPAASAPVVQSLPERSGRTVGGSRAQPSAVTTGGAMGGYVPVAPRAAAAVTPTPSAIVQPDPRPSSGSASSGAASSRGSGGRGRGGRER